AGGGFFFFKAGRRKGKKPRGAVPAPDCVANFCRLLARATPAKHHEPLCRQREGAHRTRRIGRGGRVGAAPTRWRPSRLQQLAPPVSSTCFFSETPMEVESMIST